MVKAFVITIFTLRFLSLGQSRMATSERSETATHSFPAVVAGTMWQAVNEMAWKLGTWVMLTAMRVIKCIVVTSIRIAIGAMTFAMVAAVVLVLGMFEVTKEATTEGMRILLCQHEVAAPATLAWLLVSETWGTLTAPTQAPEHMSKRVRKERAIKVRMIATRRQHIKAATTQSTCMTKIAARSACCRGTTAARTASVACDSVNRWNYETTVRATVGTIRAMRIINGMCDATTRATCGMAATLTTAVTALIISNALVIKALAQMTYELATNRIKSMSNWNRAVSGAEEQEQCHDGRAPSKARTVIRRNKTMTRAMTWLMIFLLSCAMKAADASVHSTQLVAMESIVISCKATSLSDGQSEAACHRCDADSCTTAVDNCSTRCITNSLMDYIEPPTPVDVSVKGIGGNSSATHVGTVKWSIADDAGVEHDWIIPQTCFNPQSPCRLLSPQHWAQSRKQGRTTKCVTHHGMTRLSSSGSGAST